MLLKLKPYLKAFRKKSWNVLLATLTGVAILSPTLAQADGFALQDWSARGGALAGGLVARGGDPSALVYNPATITELEGLQVQVGIDIIVPTNTIHTVVGGVEQKTTSLDKVFPIPQSYVTYKWNEDFSFGLAMFSRFGLGNEYDAEWAGGINMTDAYIYTATVNPVVAWRINDMFSVAAGLEVSAARVQLKTRGGYATNPETGAPIFVNTYNALESDELAYALGFNLGAHVRFNDQWKLGLTYRHGLTYDFDGTIRTHYNGIKYDNVSAETSISVPSEVKLALAYFPTDRLSFEAVVGYYDWSTFKSIDIVTADGAVVSHPRNWNDTWFFGLSAEYEALEWLTLRGGISYETSPVDEYHAEYIMPTNGRWKYSVGAGFHKNNWALDVSYIFHDLETMSYDKSAAADLVHGVHPGRSSDVYAHSVAASLTYKF